MFKIISNNSQDVNIKPYIAISIAIFGWGLSTSFVDFGLDFIAPLPFLALRFLVATIIISPFVLLNNNRFSEVIELLKNKWVLSIGIFEALGLTLQYFAQVDVPAGLSSLLTMLFILIVPFISMYVLNERIHYLNILAILFGLIGVFFIITEGNLSNLLGGSLIGILLLLGSAIGYAFYQISASRLTTMEKKDVDIFSLLFVVMLIISSLSLISSLIVNVSDYQHIKIDAWIWIILLAIFSSIIAFVTYFEATKGINVNVISILLLFQFLIPFLIDFLFLKIPYSFYVIAGSIIIIIAMLLVLLIPQKKPSLV